MRRINIVVGRNASGKTAFLEGLRLAIGASPHLVPWLNSFRSPLGAAGAAIVTADAFRAMWDHLFPGADAKKKIEFRYTDSEGRHYAVRIFYDFTASTPLAQTVERSTPIASPPVMTFPIIFERDDGSGQPPKRLTVGMVGSDITGQAGPDFGPIVGYFPATSTYNESDNAKWFSQISMQKGDAEIREMLEREFPYVSNLSVLSPAGQPGLYASVTPRGPKFPITYISAGIHKFLTLILACITFHRGIVLVDEIENGVYYDRLSSLWATLHRLCTHNDAQLFATTHSLECLQAALPMMKHDVDAFALLRSVRTEEGCVPSIVSGADAAAAIEQGIEVR